MGLAGRLGKVQGIGPTRNAALTVGDLAQQEAASLQEQMRAVNTTRNLVGSVPSAAQVAIWIDLAKGLPQVVTA